MAQRQVGVVKRFFEGKGFGFVSNPSGTDVFFHVSNVDCSGLTPMEGDHVEYTLGKNARGACAIAIVLTPAKD